MSEHKAGDATQAHAILAELREQMANAYHHGQPLYLQGGNTCRFYGHPVAGMPLTPTGSPVAAGQALAADGGTQPDGGAAQATVIDCRRYSGIVQYEPTELVVTVRCGTPLEELEAVLAERGQCLPFDPPRFAPGRTIGGVVPTGLSGPRRTSAGAVRDFILGTVLVSADGRVMRFGGEVMKNVAGYDFSRLLTGSMGILGLISEVSLKVLPVPRADQTLMLPMSQAEAITACNRWGGKPLPLGATCWHDGMLYVRLCGARRAVDSARQELGGELMQDEAAAAFWASLRDHRHAFFAAQGAAEGEAERHAPLWRLSVPAATGPIELPGTQLVEWGGALRWYRPSAEAIAALSGTAPAAPQTAAQALRERIAALGGTATLFRADEAHADVLRFHPLAPVNLQVHQRLKQAFDPRGLINHGRMYPGL